MFMRGKNTRYLALIFLFILFSLPAVSAHVLINEIMPNPSGKEPDGEWVELYTDQNISLNNWSVSDNASHAYSFSLIFNDYTILACNSTTFEINYQNITASIIELNCTGKGWLNNNKETLFLYNSSGNLIDNFSYSTPNDSLTFGRCPDGENWKENLIPTPGKPNNCSNTNNKTSNETNTSTIDLSPLIGTDKIIFNSGETINFDLDVINKPSNCECSVKYWIKSLYGEYLKDPRTTTNIGSSFQKQAPEICSSEVYYIEAEITNTNCNDSNTSNNFAQQLIVIKGLSPDDSECEENNEDADEDENQNSQTYSSQPTDLQVQILDAPENATQGQTITTKVKITNNYNTAKNIEIYSYIYQSHVLITEGGWTANSQKLSLNTDETKTVTLENKIKPDALLGIFTLKVRAKTDEKNFDSTKSIKILESTNTSNKISESNELESEPQKKDGQLITGKIIWSSETNKSLNTSMLIFITALLVLISALIASLWSKR
ncbi:hypothetical protein GF374_01595 [Candidatus Woesearchaeota archaeon]|nr:hypothetical protein [Candidatus Woesearchaeota archaeon]